MKPDKIGGPIEQNFPQPVRIDKKTTPTEPETAPALPQEKVKISRAAKSAAAQNTEPTSPQPRSELKTQPIPPRSIPILDNDAKQVSMHDDELFMADGYDSNRDIVGISFKEGQAQNPYRFRIHLAYLKQNAQVGNLDAFLLLGFGDGGANQLPDNVIGKSSAPWKVALAAYDQLNYKAINQNGEIIPNAVRSCEFNTLGNYVELNLDKNALRLLGWKDHQPLTLQPFTLKDGSKRVTDDLSDFTDKPWKKQGLLSGLVRTDMPRTPVTSRDLDWRDDIIYFAMTDRFSDGDKTNDFDVDQTNLDKYHGGDLQGLINKLDYIKGLGASTLWITPVMANQTQFMNTEGYHGYWPIDFMSVDKHLGDISKFKELVDKAHEKGLKVLLDLPLNHTAWEHPWAKDPDKKDWFHHYGDIKDWNDPWWVEHGSLFGLPDLAQENPVVAKTLTDIAKWWITTTNIDGFRLDAVKHIPHSFWQQFSRDIRDFAGPDFLLIGEDMQGDPNHVLGYQKDGVRSLFDMPLYFTEIETFAHDGSMLALADRMQETNKLYDNPNVMSAILDNHDLSRFLTLAGGGKDKLKLALAFLMSVNRIPTVYYGTEEAMDGKFDINAAPENRKDMQWNNDPEMLSYFKRLTEVRNNSNALKEGAFLEMWRDDSVYAYSRMTPDDEAIVVLNNNGGDQSREIPLRLESKIPDGAVLKNLLTGEEIKVANHKINVSLHGKEPKIFVMEK